MDYPVIFSAPMIRALFDGRKTMTRRMAWHSNKKTGADYVEKARASSWQKVAAGDQLWVREAFQVPALCDIQYRATSTERIGHWNPEIGPWRPSIHMPRWASRLTLVVTATKIERLQDISEADAIAEGVTKVKDACHVIKGFDYDLSGLCHTSAVTPFEKLWTHLHGDEAWDANPEVVALTFTVHKINIDHMPTAMTQTRAVG